MKLRFGKNYLLHRITAKNRHGLHSPFVSQLLDDVIYDFRPFAVYTELKQEAKKLPADGTNHNPLSVNRLLYRLVAHFNPKQIAVSQAVNNVTRLYALKGIPDAEILNADTPLTQPADCFIIDAMHPVLSYALTPQSVVVITNIHRSRRTQAAWQAIKANPQVTITIDLFYIGLVFFKPNQAREHFKLKF